ncbi:hypothetical protein Q8A73_015404 [Channa argus]|nr:hypothetical protein Q8A73_015404 [Channa argus]
MDGAHTCPLPDRPRERRRRSPGAAGPLNPRVNQDSLTRSSSKCGASRRGVAVSATVSSHPLPPTQHAKGRRTGGKTLEISTPESIGRIQVAIQTRRVAS